MPPAGGVLNAFCYSGGFTLAALAGGARSVTSIDSSADALALARDNLARNPGLHAARRRRGSRPTRSPTCAGCATRARASISSFSTLPSSRPRRPTPSAPSRAYKDINLLALKMLAPGGWLATFSCSGGISTDLFQKIVAGAALDARVDAQIVQRLGPGADHPVALNFPEGDYLKGLLLRRP